MIATLTQHVNFPILSRTCSWPDPTTMPAQPLPWSTVTLCGPRAVPPSRRLAVPCHGDTDDAPIALAPGRLALAGRVPATPDPRPPHPATPTAKGRPATAAVGPPTTGCCIRAIEARQGREGTTPAAGAGSPCSGPKARGSRRARLLANPLARTPLGDAHSALRAAQHAHAGSRARARSSTRTHARRRARLSDGRVRPPPHKTPL